MMRALTTLLILATLLALPISAAAINYTNGFISISNKSNFEVEVTIDHVFLGGKGSQIGRVVIQPHTSVNANGCCYAANSEYMITPHWVDDKKVSGTRIFAGHGTISPIRITLRHCTHGAKPFGFAQVETVLVPYGGSRNGLMKVVRVDQGCP